jgi:ubiquinone/menaquinone biosynthesis C-methylase UbiE
MRTNPFGYSLEYCLWRTSKLKQKWAGYIHKGKLLDAGGGFGSMAWFLPDDVDYYNLDVSKQMLSYSPYKNILAACEFIPFIDQCFDYIVSSEALEHVNDKVKVISECHRVLKIGGYLFLSTPRTGWKRDFYNSPFKPFILAELLKNNLRLKLRMSKPRYEILSGVKDEPSDETWLREVLQSVGFQILEQYRADNHVPWGRAGSSRLWRWFAERFVKEEKYGHCVVVICTKVID